MNNWEKSKKNHRQDDRERQQESNKKKKLKPVEKAKYKIRSNQFEEEEEE